MPTITQQEIADRRAELDVKGTEAYRKAQQAYEAAVGAELRSLEELCGAIGHVFGPGGSPFMGSTRRRCGICGHWEA